MLGVGSVRHHDLAGRHQKVWDLREHLEVNRRSIVACCVLVSLVALGVMTRVLLRDVPNFAPIAALALFAGYYFRQRRVAVIFRYW